MVFKRLKLFVFLLGFVAPLLSFAGDHGVNEDNLLFFDANTPRFETFSFDIDELERLKPKKNDFELINYASLSNNIGERWAFLTVKNTSNGRRFLKSEYLVATFVNGDQANPIDLNESVGGGEVLSKTIFFGVNKFPIILLEIQP